MLRKQQKISELKITKLIPMEIKQEADTILQSGFKNTNLVL